ncbi:lymphocyte antigen 6E-like [Anomaloglossus baeobatrachus]|uniref:lymphocyte antigen 6E-like n=1 Tax=Anomaloglossus baeobatrachus TaxID=238106 RepID=UPI003F50757C
MNTVISLVLTLLLGSQLATSLRCFQCSDPTCSELCTKTCSDGNVCMSLSYTVGKFESVEKGCIRSKDCDAQPSKVPDGVSYELSCCDWEMCNSAITNKMSLITAGLLVLLSLYASSRMT